MAATAQEPVNIPAQYQATCTYCADIVDTRQGNTYQFTAGWARNSNKGNSITLARRQRVWACHECIERLQKGIAIGQLSILDSAEPSATVPGHE